MVKRCALSTTTCERFYILAKDFGVYSMQHHNSCYYQGSRKEGAGGPPQYLEQLKQVPSLKSHNQGFS